MVVGLTAVLVVLATGASSAGAATAIPSTAVAHVRSSALAGQFNAVVCPTSSTCVAVGADQKALAEEWNGKWKSLSVPEPKGAGNSQLSSIACPTSTECLSVGYFTLNSGLDSFEMADLVNLNTGTMKLVTTTNPTGSAYADLGGISCWSSSGCMAVGMYIAKSGVISALAKEWNGSKFITETTTDPGGSAGSALDAVSCTSASNCMAVGTYSSAMSEHWNGSKWTTEKVSEPLKAFSYDLSSVSCPTASDCMAAGYVAPNGTSQITLVEQWNGSAWKVVSTADPSGHKQSGLFGVACTSTSNCLAVGTDKASSDNKLVTVPLGERWNGKGWSTVSTARETGGALGLNAVSCSSATHCLAVGYFVSASSKGGVDATAEEWTGSKWTLAPNP